MKILLTGASSFTGFHFAKALVVAGHTVVAPLRSRLDQYSSGVRSARVRALRDVVTLVEECPFGSDRFLALAREGKFDLLCHHAAEVGNYRSPDFDVIHAVAANTLRLRDVLLALGEGVGIVATGSVFEPDEGAGTTPLRAFSPYGLSKGLTWQIIRHWATVLGRPFGKFTIANPFGPYEEIRFSAYLMQSWRDHQVAEVKTPVYVRDNIHVDLLAAAYVHFSERIHRGEQNARINPSGYVETQAAFAERVAREIRKRSSLSCELRVLTQVIFDEPLVRINVDPITLAGWSESDAWDRYAAYYLR